MNVAIASGKGGTGKTTVAVHLALALARRGVRARYLDCDVEEPNGHIFLKPQIVSSEAVSLLVPSVDEAACTACGRCGEVCEFHAIVSFRTAPLVFPELCHGCGGCARACPTGAIVETASRIGVVEVGHGSGIDVVQGTLDVGRPTSPPVIRAVKRHVSDDAVNVLDCPPGTSCPVVTAVRGSDYVVLVTEPTPFGHHDLLIAIETVRELGCPFGVVVNRSDIGDDRALRTCRDEKIEVLLEIPEDRRIAEAYSRGELAGAEIPELARSFDAFAERLLSLGGLERTE